MNANEVCGRRLRRGLALMAIAASCAARAQADVAAAAAPDPAATRGWPDADIVDELLRRETRAALTAQAQRSGSRHGAVSPMRSDAPAQADPDRMDLAAIYGVGQRLDVEILLNGRRLRYRHGRKWPDEAPDGDGAYTLRAIQGHCVVFDGSGGNRRVCLPRGG
ncbi:hypothetical protein [Bordetella genomosp. 11]|uniref:Secreted protein n=1 Tax=Bordetella genomosp. 11 TaxID=1416808 RepID=A0A261UF34_9BORD|nr:hypothetical protein [Bordetella genomosp. 11]OZI59820.1 hypothetical protein CAL28_10015 [Bordetella genomosp. 11]